MKCFYITKEIKSSDGKKRIVTMAALLNYRQEKSILDEETTFLSASYYSRWKGSTIVKESPAKIEQVTTVYRAINAVILCIGYSIQNPLDLYDYKKGREIAKKNAKTRPLNIATSMDGMFDDHTVYAIMNAKMDKMNEIIEEILAKKKNDEGIL